MRRLVRSLQAASDLEDIFVYIGQKNLRAAERFLVAAYDALTHLVEFPTSGGPFESNDPQLAGIRTWRK